MKRNNENRNRISTQALTAIIAVVFFLFILIWAVQPLRSKMLADRYVGQHYCRVALNNSNGEGAVFEKSSKASEIEKCSVQMENGFAQALPKLQKISTFSTSFATSGEGRSHNVKLATDNFCWVYVASGESLSFNKIVGARTVERGYAMAKIIMNGVYEEGVGGGVCQVSTTLYNAWILAGLDAVGVQAHSLPTSYVGLSLDATVSDWIDMTLQNNGEGGVIVNGYTKGKNIFFDIYGQLPEYNIKIKSETIRVLPAELPEIEYVKSLDGYDDIREVGEQKYAIVKKERQGFYSRAIRQFYKDGKLIDEKVIRQDIYSPSRGKICILEK